MLCSDHLSPTITALSITPKVNEEPFKSHISLGGLISRQTLRSIDYISECFLSLWEYERITDQPNSC